LWPDFWKSVDVFSTKGKIEPISYDSYKKDVFGPGLQKIANARADSSPSIDQILKSDPNSDPKSDPRQKYSPFKAGRILNLMNKFPDEASHQDLYIGGARLRARVGYQVVPASSHFRRCFANWCGSEQLHHARAFDGLDRNR
jgi:hypothetical protein